MAPSAVSSSVSGTSMTSSYFSMSTAPTQQASALASHVTKSSKRSDILSALNLTGLQEPSSKTGSTISALPVKELRKSRSSVSVTSGTGSKLTKATSASYPAQSCSACGYQTFQGDKFCGGCGARLLTRTECEQLGGRSSLSVQSGHEAKERSTLSVAQSASRTAQSFFTHDPPPVPSRGVPPFAPTYATPGSTVKDSKPEMQRPSSAKALEEKLNAQPKRKPGVPKLKKKVGRNSINNWIQRENWIGTEWTRLMQPRKGEGADGPVLRSFNPPEPPLGRAPKDGEW